MLRRELIVSQSEEDDRVIFAVDVEAASHILRASRLACPGCGGRLRVWTPARTRRVGTGDDRPAAALTGVRRQRSGSCQPTRGGELGQLKSLEAWALECRLLGGPPGAIRLNVRRTRPSVPNGDRSPIEQSREQS
jgi:hypothetical protein